jgi:hypothetical protein
VRLAGHIAGKGEKLNSYWVYVGKPEGNRALGRTRCRLEDYIKTNLKEIR